MATTIAGNYITGVVGITCWADAVIAEGKYVEVIGDYKVRVPTGANSTAILGHVIKANAAGGLTYNLTVEAYGTGVNVATSGGAINAGSLVKVDTAGKVVAHSTGSDPDRGVVGLALTSTVGADETVDVLTFR